MRRTDLRARRRWRALLAFTEETDLRKMTTVIRNGTKVKVVGFGEGGVMHICTPRLTGRNK